MPEIDQTAAVLRTLAKGIDAVLNPEDGKKKNGFVLLAFPFGQETSRANYVSNCEDRKEIVMLLKEMVARFEGQPMTEGHG